MIIVSINGGLGNQMFEFAFYLKLKEIYPEIEIKLDVLRTYPEEHNGFELEKIFSVEYDACTDWEIVRCSIDFPRNLGKKTLAYLYYRVKRHFNGYEKSYLRQKDNTQYYEDFFSLPNKSFYYFSGVFANYKYFDDIKDIILERFSFPDFDEEYNKKWYDLICKTNSVSIHIRRGDYVTLDHKTLGEEYYYRAMLYMESNAGEDICYYVFSDDMECARNMFRNRSDVSYICENIGEKSYRDMQLMSCCKHNIIANSTFSFWGAYLNQNKNKIVVSSKQSFSERACSFSCDDWVKL